MKLRVNEGRLDIEKMRQLVALMDAGVLVDMEKEKIEILREDLGVEEGRKLVTKRQGVGAPRRVWTKADERKLMKLRAVGLRYKRIAKILGKTSNQIGDRIFYLKKIGRWNIPKRKSLKAVSKQDKGKRSMSQKHKAAIRRGVMAKWAERRKRRHGVKESKQ